MWTARGQPGVGGMMRTWSLPCWWSEGLLPWTATGTSFCYVDSPTPMPGSLGARALHPQACTHQASNRHMLDQWKSFPTAPEWLRRPPTPGWFSRQWSPLLHSVAKAPSHPRLVQLPVAPSAPLYNPCLGSSPGPSIHASCPSSLLPPSPEARTPRKTHPPSSTPNHGAEFRC